MVPLYRLFALGSSLFARDVERSISGEKRTAKCERRRGKK